MAGSRSWMRPLAVMAVAAIGASGLATGTAHAEPAAVLACQGTETVTYSPGIIFTPRDITITTDGRFSSCAGSAGAVARGSYGEHFTIPVGCNNLLDSFEGLRTFTWNTGDTSVVDGSGSTTAVAGQVITTITGTVVKGRFLGRTAVQTITLPQPGLLLCLTTGLTGATGVTTLTIA